MLKASLSKRSIIFSTQTVRCRLLILLLSSPCAHIFPPIGALDISAGQIGRLEGDTFVIGPAVGELEFELEENELTLTVDDMNGEWGVFLPDAAAGDETGSEAGAGDAAAGASLLEALLAFVQGSAAGGA